MPFDTPLSERYRESEQTDKIFYGVMQEERSFGVFYRFCDSFFSTHVCSQLLWLGLVTRDEELDMN